MAAPSPCSILYCQRWGMQRHSPTEHNLYVFSIIILITRQLCKLRHFPSQLWINGTTALAASSYSLCAAYLLLPETQDRLENLDLKIGVEGGITQDHLFPYICQDSRTDTNTPPHKHGHTHHTYSKRPPDSFSKVLICADAVQIGVPFRWPRHTHTHMNAHTPKMGLAEVSPWTWVATLYSLYGGNVKTCGVQAETLPSTTTGHRIPQRHTSEPTNSSSVRLRWWNMLRTCVALCAFLTRFWFLLSHLWGFVYAITWNIRHRERDFFDVVVSSPVCSQASTTAYRALQK